MSKIAEGMAALADLQQQAFEPVRRLSAKTAETYETIARKNYSVLGDFLDFSVAQLRMPSEVETPAELFERQVATTREFASTLSARLNEYVELARGFQASAEESLQEEVVEPFVNATRQAA